MKMAFWRHTFSVLLFAAGLIVGCAAIGAVWPRWRGVAQVQGKIDFLHQHRTDYDTLFIGSSRVHRHFDPALFDATAAALGQPTRSFNCGIDAMFAPEDTYLAEKLFSQPWPGLKRVFLEIGVYLPSAAKQNLDTDRSLAWHDFPRTLFLARSLWQLADDDRLPGPKQPWRKKRKKMSWWKQDYHLAAEMWPELSPHLKSAAIHATNFGWGATRLAPFLRAEKKGPAAPPPSTIGPRGNGFTPLIGEKNPAALVEFRQRLAKRDLDPIQEKPLDETSQRNLEHMVALIRSVGAEPILLIAPAVTSTKQYPLRKVGARVIDFTDRQRWPELYDPKNWHDYGHVNLQGAEIYTKAFVQEWLTPPPGQKVER